MTHLPLPDSPEHLHFMACKIRTLEDERQTMLQALSKHQQTVDRPIFIPFIYLRPDSNYSVFNTGYRLDWRVFCNIQLNYLPIPKGLYGTKDIDEWHLDAMMLPHAIILKIEDWSECFFPMQLIKNQEQNFISVKDFISQVEMEISRFNKNNSELLLLGKYEGISRPSPELEFLFDAKVVLAAV